MDYSLYFHIPFCTHRCAYCDFNTYAGQEDSIPGYVDALGQEIEFIGLNSRPDSIPVHTIFFGGGTPSLLSPEQFAWIIRGIRDHLTIKDDVEVTIEANPGTVSIDNLHRFRALGINRISLGVQSANTEELHMLERVHNFFDVIAAVSAARKSGFDNINLDLIYGLPEQTLKTWQTTIKRILDLNPEHISAYALTLEHGAPFGRWSLRGLLPIPDPDLAADMYEWASEAFESAGYVQYEISNWSKPNLQCNHNLQYWRGLPYLGLGAGAHGYANGYRYSNVLRIKTYIERLRSIRNSPFDSREPNINFPLSPAVVNQHRQTRQDEMSEFMITGLRLTGEGISFSVFRQRFGLEINEVYQDEIIELTRLGLVEKSSDILRLTQHGRLLGNQVFLRFV
jgi:oxygen-independent coproporphyrinogen-3 oxidase